MNISWTSSTITDVETAKLALRWAVEKIHTLADDNARLKEDNRNKTNIARSLTQQTEEKDEILKKWQSTIKTGRRTETRPPWRRTLRANCANRS